MLYLILCTSYVTHAGLFLVSASTFVRGVVYCASLLN